MKRGSKQRQQFIAAATKLLRDLGAVPHEDGFYMHLQTKAGLLWLRVSDFDSEGIGTVFARFDDVQRARQIVCCNPHSGKWNHHFFSDYTVETALAALETDLRRVIVDTPQLSQASRGNS